MLSCPAQGRTQTLQKLQALLVGSEKGDGGLRSGGSYSKPHVKNVHVHVLWAHRRQTAKEMLERNAYLRGQFSFLELILELKLLKDACHGTRKERAAAPALRGSSSTATVTHRLR